MPVEPLEILAPAQGIAPSPLVGFGHCKNLDIYTIPGVCVLNKGIAGDVDITGLTKWTIKNPATPSEIYSLDDNGDVYKSTNNGVTFAKMLGNVFTVTIASPAVFSDVGHGLVLNDTVVFSTTGALPTGLVAGTTYYVISAGLTADAFQVSLTEGGSAVNTSGTQSGVHSLTATLGNNGNGIVIFKNYLIVARDGRLDICGDGTATGINNDNWIFNWQTIDDDNLWHMMIVSDNDGLVYGGAGRYVFSIEEVSAFDPASGGTFTFTAQALDLPQNYRIKCLEELGSNLMIGTWMGINIYDLKIANIFPWDRASASFGRPVKINENGVNAMVTINNNLYVLAGIEGNIYRSDGYGFVQIGETPNSIADRYLGDYLIPMPGAIISHRGRLFYGLSVSINGMNGAGVYSLKESSKGSIVVLEQTIHTGSSVYTFPQIGSLLSVSRDELLVGWRGFFGGTTYYDIYTTVREVVVNGYLGYFESPLYQIGTFNLKTQYEHIEFLLSKKMIANDGIRIEFRTNTLDSYKIVGTYTYAELGDVISHRVPCPIPKSEFVQVKISFTGSGTFAAGPYFQKLILS